MTKRDRIEAVVAEARAARNRGEYGERLIVCPSCDGANACIWMEYGMYMVECPSCDFYNSVCGFGRRVLGMTDDEAFAWSCEIEGLIGYVLKRS